MRYILFSFLFSILFFANESSQAQSFFPNGTLTISNITACSAQMNWTPIPGAVFYRVKVKANGIWSSPINVGTNLNYTYTGLTSNIRYTFRVAAYSNGTTMLGQKQTSVYTLVCPVPTYLTAQKISQNQCLIKWQGDPCNSGSFNVIYKRTDLANWDTLAVNAVDSVWLNNLTRNKEYEVKVYSNCYSNSASVVSSSIQFRTLNRPNIVFILTDDMTWGNYTADGGSAVSFINSPNIDRIATEGADFKSNFATFSLCIPSRGSIMTGLYPHKDGATGNQDTLDAGIPTIAEIMHNNGYTTGFVGKYHMTSQKQPGWDYWFSFPNVSQYFDPYGNINGHDTVFVGQYLTDVINNLSMYFLDSVVTDSPFFLICAQVAPHDPFDARLQDDSLYLNTTVPLPSNFSFYTQNYPNYLSDPHHYYAKNFTKLNEELRNYYEMLPGVNDGAGMIFNYLDSKGITDNTLFMFMSDNGYLFGEHRLYRKRLPYEESIHIPLFVRYPAWFPAGSVISNNFSLNIDIAPTILDAAGITNTYNMDGVSLHSLYNGQINRHEFMYEYIFYGDYMTTPSIRAVRDFHYKYIKSFCPTATEQFFDLQTDPHENTNLINNSSYASLISQYRLRLDSFRTALNDTFNIDPVSVNCYLMNPVISMVQPLAGLDEELEGPQHFIFIYPNPSDELTTLRINYPGEGKFSVSVDDVTGKNIFSTGLFDGKNLIDFPLFTKLWMNGIYMVTVKANSETFTTKLIISH